MAASSTRHKSGSSRFESIDQDFAGGIPPHSPDVERAVLGGMMRVDDHQAKAIAEARGILQPDDFYTAGHRHVFEAICVINDRQESIDFETVSAQLEREGNLEKCGGRAAIVGLWDTVFTNANVPAHSKIVFEKAIRRRLITGCTDIAERSYTAPGNLPDLLDRANSMIGTISARESSGSQSAQDLALEALRQMEDYRANRGKPKMSWGFPALDDLTGGLRIGDYNVIAGQTSMGKTSFALNVTLKLAKLGIPVGIFTIEMTPLEITEGLICLDAKVDGLKMVKGYLTDEDYDRAAKSAASISELPIYTEKAKDIGIQQLKARTHRMVRAHGVKVVVVDYLQVMRGPKTQTREQEIAVLSRGCKVLAQEAGVCMLVLSQLSRAAKMRENKEPELSDLRDSGSIEQDADAVIFCHRPSRYDYKADPLESWLLLKKQRKGPLGRVRCKFHEKERRFEEWKP